MLYDLPKRNTYWMIFRSWHEETTVTLKLVTKRRHCDIDACQCQWQLGPRHVFRPIFLPSLPILSYDTTSRVPNKLCYCFGPYVGRERKVATSLNWWRPNWHIRPSVFSSKKRSCEDQSRQRKERSRCEQVNEIMKQNSVQKFLELNTLYLSQGRAIFHPYNYSCCSTNGLSKHLKGY